MSYEAKILLGLAVAFVLGVGVGVFITSMIYESYIKAIGGRK